MLRTVMSYHYAQMMARQRRLQQEVEAARRQLGVDKVYQVSVVWHPYLKQTYSVRSPWCKTYGEAYFYAWRSALRQGYTRPKWYEWWRWFEQ